MVKRADMEQVEKCEAPAENGPPPRLCAGFVGADQGAPDTFTSQVFILQPFAFKKIERPIAH